MTTVVLSLGSNLGDRVEALRAAIKMINPTVTSDVYMTPPWGDDDQPVYYNLTAVATDPAKSPIEWLDYTAECENLAGRVRDPNRRFGPRVLDIDIIAAYDANNNPIACDTPRLTIPHPRAHLRAFVLVPWLAIDRDAEITGLSRVRDLMRDNDLATDARALRRLGPLWSVNHD